MENLITEAMRGKGIGFERIRRITGYVTGDLSSWNDAKKHEEGNRVKHVKLQQVEEVTHINMKDLNGVEYVNMEKIKADCIVA